MNTDRMHFDRITRLSAYARSQYEGDKLKQMNAHRAAAAAFLDIAYQLEELTDKHEQALDRNAYSNIRSLHGYLTDRAEQHQAEWLEMHAQLFPETAQA